MTYNSNRVSGNSPPLPIYRTTRRTGLPPASKYSESLLLYYIGMDKGSRTESLGDHTYPLTSLAAYLREGCSLPEQESPQQRSRYQVDSSFSQSTQKTSRHFRAKGHKYHKINTSVNTRVQEEEEVREDLDSSRDTLPIDRRRKTFVGDNASRQYYKHFKGIHRVIQENKTNNIRDSAFTKMLLKTETEQVLPCKVGLIKRMGD